MRLNKNNIKAGQWQSEKFLFFKREKWKFNFNENDKMIDLTFLKTIWGTFYTDIDVQCAFRQPDDVRFSIHLKTTQHI